MIEMMQLDATQRRSMRLDAFMNRLMLVCHAILRGQVARKGVLQRKMDGLLHSTRLY